MAKISMKNRIYDILHRTSVNVCMLVSLWATVQLVGTGYMYYVHEKPKRRAEQARLEEELLNEGKLLAEKLNIENITQSTQGV